MYTGGYFFPDTVYSEKLPSAKKNNASNILNPICQAVKKLIYVYLSLLGNTLFHNFHLVW